MAYNFDELNTVNIWNIYEKVREDSAAIKFCQRYGLLRQTHLIFLIILIIIASWNSQMKQ